MVRYPPIHRRHRATLNERRALSLVRFLSFAREDAHWFWQRVQEIARRVVARRLALLLYFRPFAAERFPRHLAREPFSQEFLLEEESSGGVLFEKSRFISILAWPFRENCVAAFIEARNPLQDRRGVNGGILLRANVLGELLHRQMSFSIEHPSSLLGSALF